MHTTFTLMQAHGLRITQNRSIVLEIFLHTNKSLSKPAIRRLLPAQIHRVSLHRIITDLLKAGILSKVIDSAGRIVYHLKTEMPDRFQPHFKCQKCEQISSLPQIPDSYVKQIESFGKVQNVMILLEGICKKCAQISR